MALSLQLLEPMYRLRAHPPLLGLLGALAGACATAEPSLDQADAARVADAASGGNPDAAMGSPDARLPDGGSGAPDGGGASLTCGPTSVLTFPWDKSASTLGTGNDLDVPQGLCDFEDGWFGANGEDEAIEIPDLTPGGIYSVNLLTDQDLAFYVITGCSGDQPAPGQCLLFVDAEYTDEYGEFIAPPTGSVIIVVDTPDDSSPATGAYELVITEFLF